MNLQGILTAFQAARRWLTRTRVLVIGVCLVVLAAYCAGSSRGAQSVRDQMTDSLRTALADSSRIIEQRIAQRAPVIQQAAARVDTVRVRYADATARVTVLSDTTLRVDSLVVPTMPPVVALITSADSVIAAQDTLIRLQAAHLVDLTLDRNAWRSRALLDEASAPTHGSRFGFKTGVTSGVLGVLALLHFLH